VKRASQGTTRGALAAILAIAIAASCDREERLPGQRFDVRPAADSVTAEVTRITLPAPVARGDWTHKASNPAHAPVHADIGLPLERIWSVDIGQAAGRRHRIYADPVVSAGRVFAMDSRARLTALSLGGATLWSRDLTPAADRPDDASGGGLAVSGGRVYATTGFGELVVLDAASGTEVWRQDLQAAALGAPTISGGTAYVVSRDSRGWALDVRNGRILWELSGVPSPAGVEGGAAPAVGARLAYLPLNSSELVAADRTDGSRVWITPVVGGRAGRAYAGIDDITGDPVLVGPVIYVGNPSGRTMAIDAGSGEVLWTAREGALSPPAVVGGSVFVVSDANELVRLDARTGARVWGTQLPLFTTTRVRRRKAIYAHYGPVLAGGRLIVASSDGAIRSFDPSTGALVGSSELPGGAASNPAVANRLLFVTSGDGRLNAYR
jgi:outer membrane protein assembly factor BamB